jgi:hypothetical protein
MKSIKNFTKKSAPPVRGGSGKMAGKQSASPQPSGTTMAGAGSGGGMFGKGGGAKMFGKQSSKPSPAGKTK